MHIVYVLTRSDTRGGAQVHVRDVACELVKRGHEVTVLIGGEGPFLRELEQYGIPYHVVPSLHREISFRKDVIAFFSLMRLFRRLQPALVCVHTSKAGVLGRVAAWCLRLPVVFTVHGWAFSEGVPPRLRRKYRKIEKIAAFFASKIVTVSEYDRGLAIREKVVKPEKTITIHNGIPDVSPTQLSDPFLHPPQLVMVARFDYQKDYSLLFKALSLLRDLEWNLVCVGDGPLLESMKEEAKVLGIGDRVQFLGFCEDVEGVLASSQIFVLTSRWEGFPISILEAMRAGLPVVASDVGGCKESVVEGETGYLIPRGDHMVLAERLRELILDPGKRARMGRAGRERFVAHFTFDHMMKKLLDLYMELTESRHE